MTPSRVLTKSESTASAACSPARTDITSELGLVYLLLSTAPRKTVKVWFVSRPECDGWRRMAYIEGYFVRMRGMGFNAVNGPQK